MYVGYIYIMSEVQPTVAEPKVENPIVETKKVKIYLPTHQKKKKKEERKE